MFFYGRIPYIMTTTCIYSFIESHLKDTAIVLEAGACDGEDTLRIAKRFPKGTIYSFEPVPSLFEKATNLLKTNKINNTKIYPLALTETTGEFSMNIAEKYGIEMGSSSILPPNLQLVHYPETQYNTIKTIQGINLDEFSDKNKIVHIDFMWLDMEGYESIMLKSALNTMSRTHYIYSEVNKTNNYTGALLRDEFIEFMKHNNFIPVMENNATCFDASNICFENTKFRKIDNIKENNKMSDKYVVFHVDGGIGKNIQATAVARSIKEHHPDRKLIITSSWLEPWIHNPHIWRHYRTGNTPYFNDDFILNQDTIVYRSEPYYDKKHFEKKVSLPRIWCDSFNIPCVNDIPVLAFNQLEKMEMEIWLSKNFTKPLMLIQTAGGGVHNSMFPFSWFRDMPLEIAQKIVNRFSEKYTVIQLKYKEQPVLQNAIDVNLPLRKILSLIPFSQKRLFIDSFAQHAAAAFGLQSVVCWIGNYPEVFGYFGHINIKTKLNLNASCNYEGYLDAYPLQGDNYMCPKEYDMNTVFNADEIIATLESQQ